MISDRAIYPASELNLIEQFMRQEGFKAHEWLLGTGLSKEDMKRADIRVSYNQFDLIYRNIYRLIQKPGVGFRVGKILNLSRWSILTSALICSPTLGHALQVANDYRLLVRSRFDLIPKRVGDTLHININQKKNLAYPVNEQFSFEILIASLSRQISDLLGQRFTFTDIYLHYPQPLHKQHYERYSDNPVQFGQAFSRLCLPVNLLTRPLPLANEITYRRSLSLCQNDLEEINQIQSGQIDWLVRAELAKCQNTLPTLDEMATQLKMGARTLRRKLKAVNTCYRRLYQEHQLNIAISALSNPNLSLGEIAYQCGFSHTASFNKAFISWTQQTPKQYRHECHDM